MHEDRESRSEEESAREGADGERSARGADEPDGSAREPDEAGSDPRVVVTNGIDVDKRYFYEVSKAIGRDWDVRKLSLLGPPLWGVALLFSVAVVVRALLGTPGQVRRIVVAPVNALGWLGLDDLVRYERLARESPAAVLASMSPDGIAMGVVYVVALGAFVVVALPQIRELVRGQVDTLRNVYDSVTDLPVVLRPETWQNLNYWHPFTSHLSDRDPLVVLGEDDVDVSGVYADAPHYGNVFVDAVYVTVTESDERRAGTSRRRRALSAVAPFLYEHQYRSWRRAALAVLAVLVAVPVVDAGFGTDVTGIVGRSVWNAALLAVGGATVAALAVAVASDHVRFHRWFYANSAGLSEYSRLLNTPDVVSPVRGENRNVLSNSMAAYGLFYVSEFLYQTVGEGRYEVAVDTDRLLPEDASPVVSFGSPGDAEATAAAAELLWSAVPAASVADHGSEGTPDVTVELVGVDYRTFRERGGKEYLATESAGDRRGHRLPVKKFMSVPHGFDPEDAADGPTAVSRLHREDSWDEDPVHVVALGGGEHQQAVNKLVLSMKADGCRNLDVLENAFAGVADQSDDEGARDVYDAAQLPTEYFISFVGGDDSFLRDIADDDELPGRDAFYLLTHRTASDPDEYVHLVVGMSAVATKLGFLFWRDQFADGLPEWHEPDTLRVFHHPDPTGTDGVYADGFESLDVGALYANTSWTDGGSLEFDWESAPEYADVTGDGPNDIDIRYERLSVEYEPPDR